MRETIDVPLEYLSNAICEMFEEFSEECFEGWAKAAEETCEQMVEDTKATANVRHGDYKGAIDGKLLRQTATSKTYVWYVKRPYYRLTHLLIYGHLISGIVKSSGKTKANPFLQDAYLHAEKTYEKKCEKVIKDAAG